MVKKKERAEKWSRRGLGTARDAQVLIRIRWTLAIVKNQKPHPLANNRDKDGAPDSYCSLTPSH